MKLKTWWEFFQRLKSLVSQHYSILYVLCALVHSQGHFKTIEDMPIWGGAHPPALVSVLPGDKEHSKKDKTGDAGKNLRALRARCANACMMGAHLQGLSDAQPLGEMMLALAAPVWTAATKDTQGLKSEDGVLKRYIAYAACGQTYVVARIWERLASPAVAAKIFSENADAPPAAVPRAAYDRQWAERASWLVEGAGAASSSAHPPACYPLAFQFHEEHVRNAELVRHAWSFAASLATHRCQTMAQYTDLPPAQFATLLADDARLFALGMRKQRENWLTLCEAEKEQFDDADPLVAKQIQVVMQTIGFLHQDVPREILASLAQHSFKVLPPTEKSLLSEAFCGLGQSRVLEKAFNQTKNTARRCANVKLSRRAMRHYIPCVHRVLSKEFLRDEVSLDSSSISARGLSRTVPASEYTAEHGDSSVPEADLRKAASDPPRNSYPSTDAQGLHKQPAAWNLLHECRKASAWRSITHAWRALLFPHHGIIIKNSDSSAYIVLKATRFGVQLWPAEEVRLRGALCFRPSLQEHARARWQAVLDVEEWRACLVEPLPPEVVEHAGVPQPDAEPRLLARHKPQSAWVTSAFEGFSLLNSTDLSQLIVEKDLNKGVAKEEQPRLMLHKVLVCVRWALPGISKEKQAEIIKRRAGIACGNRRPSLLLDGNCLDSCGGALSRDDAKSAKEQQAETVDTTRVLEVSVINWLRKEGLITEAEKEAFEQARNRPARREAAKPPPDRKKIEFPCEAWIKANVVTPLGVSGAYVRNNVNAGEECWKAGYPKDPMRPTDPASRQRSYNTRGIANEAACLHVCQWLWKQHSVRTGVPCPWDFTGACA